MTPIEQLAACGWDGREITEEVRAIIAAWPKRGTKGWAGKRRVKNLCEALGLQRWPGIGVLAAVCAGRDYVSPAMAGVILHCLPGAGGFGGDADLYHYAQLPESSAKDGGE